MLNRDSASIPCQRRLGSRLLSLLSLEGCYRSRRIVFLDMIHHTRTYVGVPLLAMLGLNLSVAVQLQDTIKLRQIFGLLGRWRRFFQDVFHILNQLEGVLAQLQLGREII